VLENKIQSVNKVETLQSYLEAFNTVGTLQEETLQKINKIYTDKIEQIKNPS
jgi:NADPH-dependent 7-cyano-7-deazaguanine reductase QueF